MNAPIVVAISGGSGAVFTLRLLEVLLVAGREVHLLVSPAGREVLKTELAVELDLEPARFDIAALLAGACWLYEHGGARPCSPPGADGNAASSSAPSGASDAFVRQHAAQVRYFHYQDYHAAIASGSARTGGMVICPCSGSTASAIAHGASNNLLQRAADVHLKERRRLLLVPREAPLSAIQLENLRRCAEAGAVILPAMPGWYNGVQTLADLVDFIVARICDQLDVPHALGKRWGDPRP